MDQDKLLTIFGTEQLVSIFTEMESELQTQILNKSFRKASLLIISEAQNNLRGSYTRLAASFGVKTNMESVSFFNDTFKNIILINTDDIILVDDLKFKV